MMMRLIPTNMSAIFSNAGQKGSDFGQQRQTMQSIEVRRWLRLLIPMHTRQSVMNDKQLQQVVTDELAREPSVISEHIGVTGRAGIIALSGHVLNRHTPRRS
jgi:osmotically-inducible protein OsmY